MRVHIRLSMSKLINIYFQNCRGLNTKYSEFFRNSLIGDFDIIIAVETWLIDLGMFNLVRCNRDLEITNKKKPAEVFF